MNLLILLWISSFLYLLSGEETKEKCPWKHLKDQCHPLAHPDGSDIACEVEVKNCTGVPFQCRYVGPCPSKYCNQTSTKERRAATSRSSRLWPSAVVPYVIANDFSDSQKETIRDAMRHWEDKTCIRFKKRTREWHYVTFGHGSCCCSLVGRAYYPQYISLNKFNCVYFPTVVHEIGHAIGYWHEHNRPDRDEHVRIHFSRIQDGVGNNFNILSHFSVNSYGTPYDAISIMHYREYSFSKTRQRTIESKYGIPLSGRELSPIDIIQARRMYRCPSDPKNDPPKLVPLPASERPPELPSEAKRCGRVLTGASGCFSTPNYPQHYPENTTCGWVIHVPKGYHVKVTLEAINLDASPPYCGDTVSVYSGTPGYGRLSRRVCHRQASSTTVVAYGRTAYVRFESDTVKGTGTGFRGCFKAEDDDECKNGGYYRCRYKCINTQGSYECECPKGMFSPSLRKQTCLDHNECMDNNGGCSHKCINTYRSYKCTCPTGLTLGSDKKKCSSVVDRCRTAGCQHICRNTANSFVCSCRSGYTLDANGKTCNDINECTGSTHGCQHSCINTPGSYRCSCRSGYALSSNRKTCNDVNECRSGTHRCNHNCINTVGSYRCSCWSGNYRLLSSGRCEDINECSNNNGGCSHLCRNTPGSYSCGCRSGYVLTNDRRTCNDINECERSGACQHSCVNTVGSYRCECREGYTLSSNRYSCIDINECSNGNGGCDDVCTNTPGGYSCSCNTGGLILNPSDSHTCISSDVSCEPGTHGCQSICNVGNCRCQPGYQLSRSQRHCIDSNECLTGNGGCSHYCTNNVGAFECHCPEGLQVNIDNKTCVTRSCQLRNGNCQQRCFTNVRGEVMCSCREGFVLNSNGKTCLAFAASSSNLGLCGLPCDTNSVCIRREGVEDTCQCNEGYRLREDGVTCEDINECSEGISGCSHTCRNTVGGYTCSCPAGLRLVGKHNCTDIDECTEDTDGCQDICVNTQGSYRCECLAGYRLMSNKRNCRDIDECAESTAGCSHGCKNTAGSFQCLCPAGRIALGDDQQTCVDFDECQDPSTNECGDICVNTDGSYTCRCREGRTLSYDKLHCQDPCGGTMVAPGAISTPVSQSGAGFSPFTECEWTITASGSNVTKVNATDARMSPSQQGCENYWEFRNGPDKSSNLLKKHCGGPLSTFVSSSPSLYVKWHSGKSSGQVSTIPFVPAPFDLGSKGRVSCGGYANTDYVTDFAPAGFPAVIKNRMSCTWSLIKPLNKRELILKFAYFDVVGTGFCSDNRVEVYEGYTRRIASLCSVSGGQRTFHLRENFNRMKLIVNRPWKFRGFHATIKAI